MNFSLSKSRTSSVFRFEDGTSTFLCFALQALRMHVKRSATGSLTDMAPFRLRAFGPGYQLALTTPGIWPMRASSRKQIRQSPKSRRNARDRPQRWQRLYRRTLNLGVRFHFSTSDFLANVAPLPSGLALPEGHVHEPQKLLPLFVA